VLVVKNCWVVGTSLPTKHVENVKINLKAVKLEVLESGQFSLTAITLICYVSPPHLNILLDALVSGKSDNFTILFLIKYCITNLVTDNAS
jgi:hypothetical protein